MRWPDGAAAAVALLAVAPVLFVNAGDDGSPPTTTPHRRSHPRQHRPYAPTATPDVTGRRTAAVWSSAGPPPEGSEPGDTWQWRRPDTAEEDARGDLDQRRDREAGVRPGPADPWRVRIAWGNQCVD